MTWKWHQYLKLPIKFSFFFGLEVFQFVSFSCSVICRQSFVIFYGNLWVFLLGDKMSFRGLQSIGKLRIFASARVIWVNLDSTLKERGRCLCSNSFQLPKACTGPSSGSCYVLLVCKNQLNLEKLGKENSNRFLQAKNNFFWIFRV